MLKKIWIWTNIWTNKNITKNPSTVMELENNFQQPWNYGKIELAPMSHIFIGNCKTTPSEDIKKTLAQIVNPEERQKFIKELEVDYTAIVEYYELYPQD